MSKQFWGVIALVVLVFAGIFALSGNKADAPSKGSAKALTNHVEGGGKSGVRLVEYGDYQCPYCGRAYAPVKQAVADLNDQIYFQFRNFPLTNAHRNAFAGARAAEAADMQGKFWQMHDTLYDNQDPTGQTGWVASSDPMNQYFTGFAKQIGLDLGKFKSDYASGKVNDLINADMAEGNKLKVQGTPAFFLDGKLVDLPYSSGADAVKKVIKQEISKKQKQSANKPSRH